MKYCVTVARTGLIYVNADSKKDAAEIAERQLTDNVWWLDDFQAVDVREDTAAPSKMYVTDPAY